MEQRDLVFCSECSRAVGEQVFGTAPRADVWLLLEYYGAWEAKAVPQSDLPAAVKDRLLGWGEAIPHTKVQLIKRAEPGAAIRFFVALSSQIDPVLYRFELDSYEALLTFDLDAVLRRDPALDASIARDPLIAVCTNGRRDVSCAKYGVPVYDELIKHAPQWAWQITHLGGHRFAGTMVALPDGACYGYVDPDNVAEIVANVRDRYVTIDKLRGRSCFDPPVQAAEYYLRGITGSRSLPGVRFVSIRETGESAWSVRFDLLVDGTRHEIHLRRALSEWTTYESSKDAEPKHMPQFHFVEHQQLRRKAPRCEG